MIVDRSAQGELLRINFNISFPALSCEFATLDVSDALGTVRTCYDTCVLLSTAAWHSNAKVHFDHPLLQKRLNLTRTVRKLPINSDLERVGHYIHDDRVQDIKYDELPEVKLCVILLLCAASFCCPLVKPGTCMLIASDSCLCQPAELHS
jgi:hypothetical protein